MKKVVKKTLIVTGIITGLLLLAYGGMMMKLRSEMSGFTPMETGKAADDIFVIRDDFANMFIVHDSGQYIVFDCAMNQKTVAREMEKLGINPDDIAAVFLTHTDRDHVGALGIYG
ncbi:MAG: MBL fold metallo-hydrolase [Chitinispirillia bacterium]|nr:MBL fold metallo-hydrolase [Chitinispirillia bacterium]